MPQTEILDAFYLALDDVPGDSLTLHALADWYEEFGQLDAAACLRWTVRRKRHPYRYRHDDPAIVVSRHNFTDRWYWWAVDSPDFGRDWGHPRSCWLPRQPWDRLRNLGAHAVTTVKQYPTIRAAYEALFEIWPLFAPAVRERWL